MAYNDSYMLACHCAAYCKESTCYKSRVFLLLRHIRHKLYITYCKETWIVQQGTVDTTGYQIPFNVHYTGVKTTGTFNVSTKTFTAST